MLALVKPDRSPRARASVHAFYLTWTIGHYKVPGGVFVGFAPLDGVSGPPAPIYFRDSRRVSGVGGVRLRACALLEFRPFLDRLEFR